MKKQLLRFKSLIHYGIGSMLFFSGLARLHVRLHEFSMRQIQRAADDGLGKAQLLFGQLLTYRGATAFNKIAGLKYLHTSVLEGSKEAQFMLAEAIINKDIIDNHIIDGQNPKSEIKPLDPVDLYRLAAQSGHVMAALRLSKIYREGRLGIIKNTEQADYWLEEFIKQGKQL
jgi:TPR repeat protein